MMNVKSTRDKQSHRTALQPHANAITCAAQVLSKALRDCELDFSAVLVQQTNANLPSVSALTHQAQEQDLAVREAGKGRCYHG
jgi:ectoine hydroxylase-related dioxygenase (phytanoyl-CoA dioxygenase family)